MLSYFKALMLTAEFCIHRCTPLLLHPRCTSKPSGWFLALYAETIRASLRLSFDALRFSVCFPRMVGKLRLEGQG